jgi:hypothetical protein
MMLLIETMMGYEKTLVYESDMQSIYAIRWESMGCSSIHDHRGKQCAVQLISGQLQEEVYRYPFGDKLLYSHLLYNQSHINDQIGMHRICNFHSHESAVSIHNYYFSTRS